MVGVSAPDEHTLVYTCAGEKPWFYTMGVHQSMYPLAQGLADELGGPKGVRAMNNKTMWYNGCYTMPVYSPSSQKLLKKNPQYWDKDCKILDTVTVVLSDRFGGLQLMEDGLQLYEEGEFDYFDLPESHLRRILRDPEDRFYDFIVPTPRNKYSYQFHFNFHKLRMDGTPDTNWNTSVANVAFRKSLLYGLDLKEFYTRMDFVDPIYCENDFITMKGTAFTSDGRDYTDLVREKMGWGDYNGETMVRLDNAKAQEYKKQAIEELTALGVTFPVELDYYAGGGDKAAQEKAKILSDCILRAFGTDYVKFNLKVYGASNLTQGVWEPQLQSISYSGWGADYGDPQDFFDQYLYGSDKAYYVVTLNNINDMQESAATKNLLATYKEFTHLAKEADTVTGDLDARYEAQAETEAYFLEHAFTIPVNCSRARVLSRYDLSDRQNAMFGCCNGKMKNWDIKPDGYTTEEAANWFQ